MNISKNVQNKEYFWLFALAALFFLPGLGWNQLFDWDEINFAESAREMLVTGNFFQVQIDFQPFWEKPPLFFWLQALSMHVFGVNAFAARLPNAIIGIVTLLALYRAGTKLRDNQLGWIWSILFLASLLPHIYFRSGIIDPYFNFFIFLGVYNIIKFERALHPFDHEKNADDYHDINLSPWLAGFWIGVATLTKGPVALLMVLITYGLYIALVRKFSFPWLAIFQFFIAYAVIVGAWFGVETYIHGYWFIEKFIQYQIELFTQPVAGHEQPFYYHFIVYFVGCFPMAMLTLRGMGTIPMRQSDRIAQFMMIIWFWTVMIVFSISKTKIVHYSSMAYFPGSFLAALYFYELIKEEKYPSWETWVFYIISLLVLSPIVAIILYKINYLPDFFSFFSFIPALQQDFVRSSLDIQVNWQGWEFYIPIILGVVMLLNIVLLILKKYHSFLMLHTIAIGTFLSLILIFVVPKVSAYSQGPAISFFKTLRNQDCYVVPIGYKTYAHYFYAETKKRPDESYKIDDRGIKQDNTEWFFSSECNKPVYFSMKISREKEFLQYYENQVKKIYSMGGFVFYRKK